MKSSFRFRFIRNGSAGTIFIFLFAAFFFSENTFGQTVQNLPKYDHQPIHFGFTLGVNSTTFKIEKVENFNLLDSVYVIEPEGIAGLNIGILSNLRMGDYFDLRFLPALSFAQRNLKYSLFYLDTLQAVVNKQIESTYMEFPLDIKFKSQRLNNYRMYALIGGKYAIDMISQAKVESKDKQIVKLKRFDYGYEYGFGFDFYLSYFKMSMEFKVYHGLNNLLVEDNTIYSSPLEKLFSKVYLFSFTFE